MISQFPSAETDAQKSKNVQLLPSAPNLANTMLVAGKFVVQ
jgi:hypothetical protein